MMFSKYLLEFAHRYANQSHLEHILIQLRKFNAKALTLAPSSNDYNNIKRSCFRMFEYNKIYIYIFLEEIVYYLAGE